MTTQTAQLNANLGVVLKNSEEQQRVGAQYVAFAQRVSVTTVRSED
jgi:hypothetical protein